METVLKAIADWIKGILTAGILSNLSGLFDDVNTQVGNIAQQVGTKPSSFEPRVFAMIEALSRNVVLPIAGIILTFIACYELIEMITQHNNMAQFEPALIMRWIFKTAVSVWLISNTFDIVMAVFDITQKVVSDSSGIIAGNTRVNDIGLSMLQSSMMQMDVGPLFGLFLQSFFIGITMRIFRRRIPPRSTKWCGLQRSRRNSLPPCCGSRLPPPRTRLRCLPWVQLLRRRSMQMKIKKLGALLVSVALCAGMAAPAFAYGGEPVEEVEQPVLTSTTDEEDVVTVTDEETGALTPEGNLTLVDDYHTDYSDGSGQQFITLVSKSGATFYLVIDRNAKGQQTVHFMNLVDEADLLALMEEDAADAYTAEKEAAAQAELDRLKAEEEAKKAAEEAAASGEEQPKENKVTKIASGFLGVVVLIALAAGGGFYVFAKQKQKKQAEKEALDPDANYTEDKGDFEIPVEDEPEETDEEDTEPI